MNTRWLVLFFIVIAFYKLKAQDIHFSQFKEAPLQVNPSFAGNFPGDQRFIMNYRNQWSTMGIPYTTYAFSFDMPFTFKALGKNTKLGLGTFAYRDIAGDLNMGILQANINLAAHVRVSDNHFVSAGLMTGFVQRSIDPSNARWGSQFDGYGYNADLPAGSINVQAFSFLDVSGGVSWLYTENAATLSSKDNKWVRVGLAVGHLSRPQQKFYEYQLDRIGMKPTLFAEGHYGISNTNIALRPQLLIEKQIKHNEWIIGNLFWYRLSEESHYTDLKHQTAISIGALYRVKDAVIGMMTIEYANFALGISYDYSLSPFKGSALEISLRYINPNPFKVYQVRSRFN
ncbi:MAG: type IX secretion system membrane protein PorP/SprF [Bacteroidetes bacterium]|nr:MAG: type IX secretion system membrane protein PorP/SprF [Bacteroidota bacterium]